MRKIQIGVMGSAADTEYSDEAAALAEEIGKNIAGAGAVTVYGAEKDYDSLSTAAARGAKDAGGTTVGVTYGRGKNIFDRKITDITICCGMDRGGGREFVLVNSCDVIIALSGGSGTLTEMAIAYQAGIPIVCLKGLGGWSDRLAGSFIDSRERLRCIEAKSAEEAVALAIRLAGRETDQQ
jgi:uncharacterized protein (TIGR00725 family)